MSQASFETGGVGGFEVRGRPPFYHTRIRLTQVRGERMQAPVARSFLAERFGSRARRRQAILA